MIVVLCGCERSTVCLRGHGKRLGQLALVIAGVWGVCVRNARGHELDCTPAIVRWAITSGTLLQSPSPDAATIGTVSKGVMLAVLPIETAPEDRSFIFVKPIGSIGQRAGWISYASTAMSLATDHLSDRGWNSTAVSGMPILIQRLPEVQREDWRKLTKGIADAEREGVFVPDAYVARAELWTIAGDTSKAVEDFRRAADTALKAGRTPSEQSAYLRLLRDALQRLEQAPRPADGARANDYESAAAHFGAGVHLFWRNALGESLAEFQNAIALNPKEPMYWYFQGLARRRLGDSVRAQHDALLGAFLERSRPVDRSVSGKLSRVQGPDRFWLEAFRKGDPSQQLLRLELAGVNVRPGVSP